MSYILEALKKSSEERARLSGGRAQQAPAATVANHGSPAMSFPWRWVAGLGLALLAMAAVYFALISRGTEPVVQRVPAVSGTPEPVAALAPPQQAPSTPPVQTIPVAQPIPAAPPVKLVQPAEAPPSDPVAVKKSAPPLAPRVQAYETELKEALKAASAPPEKPPAPAPAPAASPSVAAYAPASPPAPTANASAEMPPELLRQVQAIPIAAHIYSARPADRMVIVDGRAAREGDVTASGMAIEQITPTGIVVTYKGYRANRTVH